MDQSVRANSTGSQESVTPPQLEWSSDGWSGRNEHFRVVKNIIKIKKTDADISNIPTERQREWNMDEEGIFSVYEEIKEWDNHIYQLWMGKMGPYLADWVLGKSPNGAFFIHSGLLQPVLIDRWSFNSVSPMEAREIPRKLHPLGPQERL
jgi:hypothetical protein